MSSIQQGIQAAHAQTRMALKYPQMDLREICIANGRNPEPYEIKLKNTTDMYFDWAQNHETMICLSGGMDINLQEIKQLMAQPENTYPWAYFNEAQEAMAGMLTNVAIVLPEHIYEAAANIRARKWNIINNSVYEGEPYPGNHKLDITDYDIRVIKLLNSCGLAK